MSRYRLLPTPAQEAALLGTTAATPGTSGTSPSSSTPTGTRAARAAPGYLEQCRQLTAARAEHPWLAAGSQTVQQQALRDFAQAMTAFLDPANPARRPSWRKAGRHEGFRIVGARPAVGRAPRVPEGRPGLGAQSRMGPVPLVPRRAPKARSPTG